MKKIYVILLTLICLMGFGLSFNKVEAANETFTSTITASNLAATSTTYKNFTYSDTTNGITYVGQSAKHSSGAIQLRSTDHAGIIVTANENGYVAKKVTVVWATDTASGRTLDVYGSATAYTGENASALYDSATRGTKIGSIVKGTSTELTITGSYSYLGLRSNSGAMYITSITITWEASSQSVQDAFASIRTEAGLSFGYTETVTSAGINKSKLKTTDEVNAAKRIVIVSKLGDKYYAMNNNFSGTEITLAEDGSIASVLSDGHLWDVEAGTGDNAGKIALKNVSTSTYLTPVAKKTSVSLEKTATYINSGSDNNSNLFVYLTSGRGISMNGTFEFKHYSNSNLGKTIQEVTYSDSLHIFKYEGSENTSYSSFNNIQLKFRYTFDPSNYTGEVTEQGFIVTDDSTFDFKTSKTSLTPAADKKLQKVVKNVTTDSFVLAIDIPLLADEGMEYYNCLEEFFVCAYIVVDGTYYFATPINNGAGYSVDSIITMYNSLDGDQALSDEIKALLKAFQSNFNN